MYGLIQQRDHNLSRYKILKRRLEHVEMMDDSILKSVWMKEIKEELKKYEMLD